MYGFYFHFNNLHFKQSKHTNDISAAHVVISALSSETMRCRLSKWLLDHPVNKYRGLLFQRWETNPPRPCKTNRPAHAPTCKNLPRPEAGDHEEEEVVPLLTRHLKRCWYILSHFVILLHFATFVWLYIYIYIFPYGTTILRWNGYLFIYLSYLCFLCFR